MSKKHKHHNNNNQAPVGQAAPQPSAEETTEVSTDEIAAALAGTDEGESVAEESVPAAEAPSPEIPSEPVSVIVVPSAEPPKAEEPPKPVVPVQAKPVEVEPSAPKISIARVRRPVPGAVASAAVKKIQDEIPEDPHRHTPAGRRLMRMFDEYAELGRIADANKNDEQAQIRACQKLFDIMTMCCPRNGNPNAGVYIELIRIVFKRLSQGYGTIYKDSNLLRVDYRLPTPTDSMKFDTFWTVMYQLVECAKTHAKITYNTNTVAKILGSPSAMVAISQLRRRLEGTIR